ncbi:MAG: gamma-glutamyl-gamma-aminobutyrate hydrolase family protein [Rikenellaceae bacterium]
MEKKQKPIIGVIPLWDDTKNSIWMLPGYMDVVQQSGGIPIILPLGGGEEDIQQVCEMCDGFLFTGGHDVDPALYGEPMDGKCGTPNPERDRMESMIFEFAVERDMAVLGICRGIQLINSLCGGTLYQDLPTQYIHPSGVNHQMTPPYDKVQHTVTIMKGNPLHQIVGEERLGVNSYHHQAIKELAPTLEATALSEDGLIEAIYMPSRRFIHAVQWHPELNFHYTESSKKIVRAFIKSCF